MEISWNFVSPKKWEPWPLGVSCVIEMYQTHLSGMRQPLGVNRPLRGKHTDDQGWIDISVLLIYALNFLKHEHFLAANVPYVFVSIQARVQSHEERERVQKKSAKIGQNQIPSVWFKWYRSGNNVTNQRSVSVLFLYYCTFTISLDALDMTFENCQCTHDWRISSCSHSNQLKICFKSNFGLKLILPKHTF